jgi:hypothetical protein
MTVALKTQAITSTNKKGLIFIVLTSDKMNISLQLS